MGRTHKSDLASGFNLLGNGSSGISPAFPILDMGKFTRTSDFTINPPNVRIDADVKMLVTRQSEKLRFQSLKNLYDEKDWNLEKILKSPEETKDIAKARLVRDGKSAVISEVSRAINASSLDHSSKYLLSNEPLYVYALSYAIYQEEVDDSEGLNDRVIVATENKIKPYFNKLLAKKYIKDRHLNLSEQQKKSILQTAATTHISYLQNEPAKAIHKIISKYVDYGELNILVDKFFESGKIDPEKGTPQIRQLMVKYLLDIGLTVKPSDLNPGNPSPAENKPPRKESPSKEELRTGPSGKETTAEMSPSGSGNGGSAEAAADLSTAMPPGEKNPGKDKPNPGSSTEKTKTGK